MGFTLKVRNFRGLRDIDLGQLLQRYRIYPSYDLRSLRRSGSSDSSERRLALAIP